MTLTPSQTIGPFFGHALPYSAGPYLSGRTTRPVGGFAGGCATALASRCPTR